MVRVIDSGKCGMVVANNNDGRYVVKLDKDPNVVALLPSEFEVLCFLFFCWQQFHHCFELMQPSTRIMLRRGG